MVLLGLGCGQEALKAVALTGGPTGTGVWPGGTKGSSTYWWSYWDLCMCGQEALKAVALTGGPTGTGVWPGGTKDSRQVLRYL